MTRHTPTNLHHLTSKAFALASLALCAFAPTAMAQAVFPNKPITLVVTYPPGGGADAMARLIAPKMGEALGQAVIIENLGGAGGAIAAQKVLSAPADGYYLFQGSPNELILAPLAMKAVKHKPEDFRLIQEIALAPIAISARKDFPPSNAKELVDYARKAAKDGKPVSYASVGTGSLYHLMGEDMARKMGTTMLHVPYNGGGPGLIAVVSGETMLFGAPLPTGPTV